MLLRFKAKGFPEAEEALQHIFKNTPLHEFVMPIPFLYTMCVPGYFLKFSLQLYFLVLGCSV